MSNTLRIAGFSHRQAELSQLSLFDTHQAQLIRDPQNPFDANAIKVLVDDLHIGFVPAKQAAIMAPRMDEAGKDSVSVHVTVKRQGKSLVAELSL